MLFYLPFKYSFAREKQLLSLQAKNPAQMVWTIDENSAICTPDNSSHSPCTASMLTFLNFSTLYLRYSDNAHLGWTTPHAENMEHKEVDFIVVGVGSAGWVVANRLSENPNGKLGEKKNLSTYICLSSSFVTY